MERGEKVYATNCVACHQSKKDADGDLIVTTGGTAGGGTAAGGIGAADPSEVN